MFFWKRPLTMLSPEVEMEVVFWKVVGMLGESD
jgi:hypothetical protein